VWYKIFTNYFGFNKQQRIGLYVLLCIMLLLFIIRVNINYFIKPSDITISNLPEIETELTENYNSNQKNKSSTAYKNQILFAFNPNTVTYEQLLKLGFKEKTAKTFIKYRASGFVFKKKEDLKKIYGITDFLYNKLEEYILIEEKLINNNNTITSKKTLNVQTIDLNTADSVKLIELKGIGPSFAKRIIKYRTLLGGFINKKQLLEVYGFTQEMYNLIERNVEIKTSEIIKININKDDFKVINQHPYITYEHTKEIMNLRRKTAITSENIKTILNDEDVFLKLLPYLDFE
jgi:competence protein ComEA